MSEVGGGGLLSAGSVSRNIGSISRLLPTPIPGGSSGVLGEPVVFKTTKKDFHVKIKMVAKGKRARAGTVEELPDVVQNGHVFYECLNAGIDRCRRISSIHLRSWNMLC